MEVGWWECLYDYIVTDLGFAAHHLVWGTIPALFLSEALVPLFTLCDVFKLDYLKRFRIQHGNKERPYPDDQEIIRAGYDFLVIFFFGLLPITLIGLTVMTCFPEHLILYDLNRVPPSGMKHLADLLMCTLMGDFLFYWLHYAFHHPLLYPYHRHHHRYRRDSFALVNHVLHPSEAILFVLPPAIPPMVLGCHISTMWLYAIVTNWIGTYIHSGYDIPGLAYLIAVCPQDHDMHHVSPKNNFSTSAFFSLIDRVFGTYRESPDLKK